MKHTATCLFGYPASRALIKRGSVTVPSYSDNCPHDVAAIAADAFGVAAIFARLVLWLAVTP